MYLTAHINSCVFLASAGLNCQCQHWSHDFLNSSENVVVVQRGPADAYRAVFLMKLTFNPSECLSAVRPSLHPPIMHRSTFSHDALYCIVLSFSLSLMPFSLLLPGPKKRQGFFSWETLGEVCCSVSREWEWNPVFLGLVSLPVLRSHHRLGVMIGIVSGLAAV